MYCAGQTFLYPLNQAETAHLWIIATNPNPEGEVAVVSFTSLRGAKDQTVIVRAREHDFVRWDTCVCYQLAEVTTTTAIKSKIDSGLAEMKSDVSAELLEEVLVGFTASDMTKNRVREFVRLYRAELRRRTR